MMSQLLFPSGRVGVPVVVCVPRIEKLPSLSHGERSAIFALCTRDGGENATWLCREED
jgi:hypothetical protein